MVMYTKYIELLKRETNYNKDIIYREKNVRGKKIYIIFSESLTDGSSISEYIIKSLDEIKKDKKAIINDIYNFKVIEINTYDEIVEYINNGFTIILSKNYIFALETKNKSKRSIDIPKGENTIRGAKDAFTEDFQTNIYLIKKRIKNKNLWIKEYKVGNYTKTTVDILYINGKVDNKILKTINEKLENANIDGILNSGAIKSIIGESNINPMPTTITTERPDRVSKELLKGKIAIIVDNDPYVLIVPAFLNDFFKTTEDYSEKNINSSLTRILRYLSFYIALFTPALYIALITYNQEMLPTEFLVNFAMQRSTVPFPAFFEAFMMITCFEILRESDIRSSGFVGSSLSIVGALILGEAAVSAGIVSPIMIIVVALTAISSLPFSEYELVNGLRWYRILFMIGASTLGMIGIVYAFIYFIINLSATNLFGKPYLMPFVPTNFKSLKDSIIRINRKE